MSTTSSSDGNTPVDADDGAPHRAGAFDIRNFIAMLIGIYGVILVIYGIIGSNDTQLAKSDNVNINLWAGLGMLVVGIGFFVWAKVRPVVVPAHIEHDDDRPPAH
jgi:hypothetical protein